MFKKYKFDELYNVTVRKKKILKINMKVIKTQCSFE